MNLSCKLSVKKLATQLTLVSANMLAAIVLGFVSISAQADVLLTFKVSDVMQNDCTGRMQPTCALTVAASFAESVRIADVSLATSDTSTGSIKQTGAFFNFPNWLTGTPYSSNLSSRLSNPVTFGQAYTQVDSTFDTGSSSGSADALIVSDMFSDTTTDQGMRTQQEYKLSYNLFSNFFDTPFYTDLVNETLFQFFNKNLGNISGTFDELGTTGSLDALGLGIAPYSFTEYTGRVTLSDVQNVSEPGILILFLAALLGMMGVSHIRKSESALPIIG